MHNSLKCILGSLRQKEPIFVEPAKHIKLIVHMEMNILETKRYAMKILYARLKSYQFIIIIIDDASAMKTAVVVYSVQ